MALAVDKNATSYSLDIGILDPYAALLATNRLANAIQQLGRRRHGRITLGVWEAQFQNIPMIQRIFYLLIDGKVC